ncbi:MAG TPA: glycosyltransferase family 1 protein [Pseudomonas sp.]|nr:glycosyltransferase family 1 protein [Pseudomonas sp.]
MKIVYVITRSDVIGGASVHLLDLAVGVQELGHEVSIFVGGNGILNVVAGERGLDCGVIKHLRRKIDPVNDVLCFFELRSQLAKCRPDIVHLHSSKAGLLGRLACCTLSIPVVYTAHGWAFTEGVPKRKRRIYALVERFMARLTKIIITVSDYDRNLALSYRVGHERIVKTIHNGMPDLSYENGLCEGAEEEKNLRLIMVARFEAPKDHLALLEALNSLKHFSWSLELVGDGPLLPAAKDAAKHFGLADRVVFSGACDDVSQRLACSDIFILISQWEGLPLTILEAMRAGLPVIASNVGGVSEAVETGVTGFLVDRNDIAGITESVTKLIVSRDLRIAMGKSGRIKFLDSFTFSKMLAETLSIYNELVMPHRDCL